jgi:putative glutamine amidotransferase
MWADTLNHTYRNGITRAGGIPVLLAQVADDAVPHLLDRIDGLLLTGGGDVDPSLYGSERTKEMYGIDPGRDRFEMALAREAFRRKLPVLAVCRGIQILNVALGGSLIEDIPSEIGSDYHAKIGDEVFVAHQRVQIDETCGLAALVGATDLAVNSIHHQALRRVADGIHPVAWAEDGVIEAIESDDPDWPLIGVQWHPEYLGEVDDDPSQRLFAAFIENAATARLTMP